MRRLKWVCISAGVHLAMVLLLGGLSLQERPEEAEPPPLTYEAELVPLPYAVSVTSPRPATATATRRAASRAIEPHQRPPAPPRSTPRPEPRHDQATRVPSRAAPEPTERPGVEVPVVSGKAEESASPTAAPPAPSSPSLSLGMRPPGPRRDSGGDHGDDGGTAPSHGREDKALAARVSAMLAEDLAIQNQKDGRVEPLLFDIARTAKKVFHPKWELTEGDQRQLGTISKSSRDFIVAVGRDYLKRLEEMNSRKPSEPENRPPPMLEQYRAVLRVAQDSASGLSCDLCAVIAFGTPPEVQVERSSGRPPFDALARQALERALRLEPATKTTQASRACYRFEALFFRIPPIPMAGCVFDEVHLDISCYYPTKKILNASTKLLSVKPLPSGS